MLALLSLDIRSNERKHCSGWKFGCLTALKYLPHGDAAWKICNTLQSQGATSPRKRHCFLLFPEFLISWKNVVELSLSPPVATVMAVFRCGVQQCCMHFQSIESVSWHAFKMTVRVMLSDSAFPSVNNSKIFTGGDEREEEEHSSLNSLHFPLP